MKLQRYILLMVLAFTLGGCAPQGRITGQEFVDVNGFFRSYMETFNSRDMHRLMGYYAPTSLTYVLNDSGGYYLTKDDLLKAFEMKKEGWEKKNLLLTDVTVISSSASGTKVTVDVEFSVNSTTWIGEYRVRYAVDKVGGNYQIVEENI